jgi:RND family efflux transporter MFP subunit
MRAPVRGGVRANPVLLLLGLSLTLPLASCDGSGGLPPAPTEIVRPVKTAKVSASGGVAEIELHGEVRASKPLDLAFKGLGGRLVELPVAGREGQEVMPGELLAEIDSRGFEAALNAAARSYEDARSVLDLARVEKERMEELKVVTPDLVSASMLQRTRDKLAQAEDRVATLEAEWERAEDRLENSSLRAPFAGVIVQCHVHELRDVEQGEPIVSLRNNSRVDVLVEVPEKLMSRLGDLEPDTIEAVASLPSRPGEAFPLEVREAAQNADPASGTYRLVLAMSRPEAGEGLPGMAAKVLISAQDGEVVDERVAIPAIAVVVDPEGRSYVWVVDTRTMVVHRRDVELGRLGGSDSVEILSGLAEGEVIVLAGVLQLSEGRRVRLWGNPAPSPAQ